MPTRLISQVTPFNSSDNNDYGLRASAVQYGTSSTGAGTAAKAVTCATFTADYLVEGAIVAVKFNNTNTATASNLTLNVSSTGAKSIKYIYNGNLSNLPDAGYLKAGQIYLFYYDGTNWVTLLNYDTNDVNSLSVTSNNNTAAFGSAVTVGTVKGTDLKFTMPSSVPEAILSWGGKNFSGSYGPIDAAMIETLGANRFAFLKAAGLTIEYSTDGGSSWTDYGATDVQKTGLFGAGQSFYLGKHTTAGSCTTNDQLRITIATSAAGIYTVLNKIAIYMSTSGATVQVKMEKALESTPTTYTTHLDWTGISGWSGWNILNISNITTYGNTPSTQYGRIRFTFKQTAVNTSYSSANISRIMGYGGMGWSTPSNMAANGHLYRYDNSQNAIFPAEVTATTFKGNLDWSYIQNKPSVDIPSTVTSVPWNTDTTIFTYGGSSVKIKIPANPNTDSNVLQTAVANGADYRILFSGTASNDNYTGAVGKDGDLKYNPSTNNLQVVKINGVEVGNTPKFTDTTYTFTNSDATLAWDTRTKIAEAGGTSIYVKLPANPNVWNANALNVAGYVAAPTSSTANKVWKTNASGEPAWRDDADTQTTVSPASPIPTLSWGNETDLGSVNGTHFKVKMPSNPNTNTDTLVTQTVGSTSGDYPILLKHTANETEETNTVLASSLSTNKKISINPTTGNLTVYKINGVEVGNTPKFTDTTYTFTDKNATLAWDTTTEIATVGGTAIHVKLPANPNTHYTANLVTTTSASGTSNAAVTANGSLYLNLIENSSVRNSHNIVGDGTVTVKSDANGKITITGSDTNTDTKVTNTLATTTKYYVTGTTSASTNTGTQSFDTGIYATTTAGQLNAKTYKVDEAVTLEYNSTTKSLDFIFA